MLGRNTLTCTKSSLTNYAFSEVSSEEELPLHQDRHNTSMLEPKTKEGLAEENRQRNCVLSDPVASSHPRVGCRDAWEFYLLL